MVIIGTLVPIYVYIFILYILPPKFQDGFSIITVDTKCKVISDIRCSRLPAGISYNLRAECEDYMPNVCELVPVLAHILEQDTDASLRQVAALVSAMSVITLTYFRLMFYHIMNNRHPFAFFISSLFYC